ncbi:MAG: FKBP-type peptidyl-prolyl cis-trans isomerase [Rhodothermales bacterium]|nr:FKBP-type peptidyl-prolyl cis-trans isomerase [Rhodothermales bacterium]MBO6779225.1 FKBP-type peptidyl-prolyl cis-trans isomerase [Rhodothermales bacterium]
MTRFLFSMVLAALVLTGCKEEAGVQSDDAPETQPPATLSSANLAASAAFMSEMADADNVQATGTGLLYEVITEGSGENPNAASIVTVHYEGALPDGTVFESSFGGQTITFPLSRVIPGWTEGVQLMSPGAKYKFYIPPELGYGQMGTPGGPIGPNQALVFTIELFEFE